MNIPANISAFWQKYLAQEGEDRASRFYEAFHFADSKESANELAGLVLMGIKRATAALLWADAFERKPRVEVGALSVLTNWEGTPLCVIETTRVDVLPFQDVPPEFAALEGEGDLSLRYWREAHWAYFERDCRRIGVQPTLLMPVVCERFRVVFPDADPHG